MADFSIDTNELERLAKQLAHVDVEKQKEARTVTQRVAREVKSRAKAAAPRDRPLLATRLIHTKTWSSRDGLHVDVFTGMDERGFNVGFYVEYGTSDTPPQPFLTPQTAWAAGELVERLTEIVDPFEQNSTDDIGDD